MPRDVLISCMGLRRMPDWLPWAGDPPKLLEWPGAPTPGGHPSWKAAARSLRDSDGAMLPTLFKRYRRFLGFDLAGVNRIAVVGFSAGSNSGVRELLRSPLDRSRISFAAAIDGMHPMLAPRRVRRQFGDEDPADHYADWAGQMGPFAEFALEAAEDQGNAFVATASQVRPPSGSSVAPSYLALSSLFQYVATRSGSRALWLPNTYPPRDSSPALRDGEAYPRAVNIEGAGRFAALWYAGSDKRAHQLQAWVVAPDVLRAFLIPLWGGEEPRLVGSTDEMIEPPIARSLTRVSGLPNWTGALPAVAAVTGAAFV